MNYNEDSIKQLEELFELYKKYMYSISYNILSDHQESEDAVICALTNISKHIKDIELSDSPKTKSYFATAARNAAIDIYRKKTRGNVVPVDRDSMEAIAGQYNSEGGNAITSAILSVPTAYRDILLLRFAHGYSVKEIAGVYQCKTSKIEKRISRGKRLLKEKLEKEGVRIED